MKKTAILLMVAGFLAAVLGGSVWGAAKEGARPAPAPAADAAKAVAAANNAFAADLYQKLAAAEGNLFFSPNSVETALVMTYAGARDRTAEQMAAVLHLPAKDAGVHAAFGAFLKDLNAEKGPDGKPRGYQLSVANALWGQDGYGFLPEFMKTVKTNYGAGLSEVDFAKDTEGARRTINTWAEKETRDKIKDLIPEGVLDASTRLVLTNAIYFKGDWSVKFKKEDTKDEPFHVSSKKTVDVPMMHRTGEYGYMETEALQLLRLPYAGNELSMIVFLPKSASDLEDAELAAVVSLSKNSEGLERLRPREVVVTLPKFKMTAEFELNKSLSAMGMVDAFTGDADFSGMDGQKDLLISNVIHKAFVDVNEEGTEAAAATAVVIARMSAPAEPEPPIVFKADHPFLFLIRHEKSGAILFMGRLADPTK